MKGCQSSFVARHRKMHLLRRNFPFTSQHSRSRLGFTTQSRTVVTDADTAEFNEETDLLIIGSGAGALTASLRAKSLGLHTIIVEKQDTIGGASVISGGGLWIPCNSLSKAAGINDSEDAALQYFQQAVGNVGPASSVERRKAYVSNAPRMIGFLQEVGLRFRLSKGYPDYYPFMKGAMGKGGGRSIESKVFNFKELPNEWRAKFPPPIVPLAIYGSDGPVLTRPTSSLDALWMTMLRVIPLVAQAVIGHEPVTLGRALVAQLLLHNIKHNTDIRVNNSLSNLIQDSKGGVVGAELRTPEGSRRIRAIRGVVLAAGGFARNLAMRQHFMPTPASIQWTSSPQGDTGDAIQEGMRLGAATALLDDAWWGPTIIDPVTAKVTFALFERTRPHSFIVDSAGLRFMNEAQSYTDAGHDQYARNRHVKAIPAWLIMDTNHRNKYMLGNLFAGMKPSRDAFTKGRIFMASTLTELAQQIGVDSDNLVQTTDRYNDMCRRGIDVDFGKGNHAYDQFLGDSSTYPNPNMSSLIKAPYYAVPIWPGDLGTKGGLLTDEYQRVLKQDLEPIPGLFAIGNTAASIMGRTYLGAGSTLGPAMTHGYIVANYVKKDSNKL
ncbi:3-oxosteroid 1-dehydrogenase [Paramyrothecium foliicola]|nr:3-oxosteroid 1-dehydrogenase [Paramyrothecium foliicola]